MAANHLGEINLADRLALNNTKPARMSLIVGIVCESGIVLAAESQTTYTSPQGDAIQRLDTQKINVVEFGGEAVLIAETGETTYSGRAVEFFNELSKGKTISDYRDAAEIAQQAVRKTRETVKENLGIKSESEFKDHIFNHNLNFALMIAHYHESKPYIFTIRFSEGIANKRNDSFLTLGVRGDVAHYILSRCGLGGKSPFHRALLSAIYTVEEIKKMDPSCGGKVKVAIIAPVMDISNSGLTSKAEMARGILNSNMDHYIDSANRIDTISREQFLNALDMALIEANVKVNASSKKA